MKASKKHLSVARQVRRRVMHSKERFWHTEDFAGGAHAVDAALARLAADGELKRVRRGLYWRGRMTRFGMTPHSPERALLEIAGNQDAIGPAESYATNMLGLSTQVSPVPIVATTGRVPEGLDHIRIISRAGRRGRRSERLNAFEVAILEALEGWDLFVEVEQDAATKILIAAIGRVEARVERLVAAASTEAAKVRERLREILSRAGYEALAATIERARSEAARKSALAVFGA